MKVENIRDFLNFKDHNISKAIKMDNPTFNSFLTNAINQVNEMQKKEEVYKDQLAVGELDNLHDLTIATEKADITLQLTMAIRNKVVEAYKEIMRMQI